MFGDGPASRVGLSQREMEISRRVAEGKRHRDITAALIISLSTIASHVDNILKETCAANRTEAAT